MVVCARGRVRRDAVESLEREWGAGVVNRSRETEKSRCELTWHLFRVLALLSGDM
jgi:hypothetical protein